MQNPPPTEDRPTAIGSVGWRHAGWRGGFYPDDLPEEWRLAYYANEFSTVLLPASEWRGAPPEELAEWAAEVDEGFRFVLERDGDDLALERALEALGEHGVAAPAAAPWSPEGTAAGATVGRLRPDSAEPKALRRIIEAFTLQAPAGERFLFVDGEPPNVEALRVLLTLRDLLGH